jgi:hypothetical protein
MHQLLPVTISIGYSLRKKKEKPLRKPLRKPPPPRRKLPLKVHEDDKIFCHEI